MTQLARVAGSTCFRSPAELEHDALKLLQDLRDGNDPRDAALITFMEDTVRLIRETAELKSRNYATSGRPGTWIPLA